jgi:hypothetical protein
MMCKYVMNFVLLFWIDYSDDAAFAVGMTTTMTMMTIISMMIVMMIMTC